MIDYNYKIFKDEIILSFSVNKLKKKKIHEDIVIKVKNEYEIYLDPSKIDHIFKKMLIMDSTLNDLFNDQGFFEWHIALPFGSKKTKFHNLLPLFVRNIKTAKMMKKYQTIGSNWLQKGKERVLADDMGLGKSLQTIQALNKLFEKDKIENFIIICPLTLIENWKKEFNKWAPQMKISEIDKNTSLASQININNGLIMNYEILEDIINKNKNDFLFDIVIADEAHRLRNQKSKTHEQFLRLDAKRKWFLTGTPLERDNKDIEGILVALNKRNVSKFSNVNEIVLKHGLKKRALRRLKKEVLSDLPDLIKKVEIIKMTKNQAKEYKDCLFKMTRAPFEEKIGFLPRLIKIATISSQNESPKIDRAIELIKDITLNGNKIVVFSYINEPLFLLNKKLKRLNIKSSIITGDIKRDERSDIVEEFQKDEKLLVLLCNGKVAGEGINLTKASSVIFLNEAWNPSTNRQAQDRVNRLGQLNNVNIYLLRSGKTIDEDIEKILVSKGKLEISLLERIEG
tara:strand:+ start:9710 stop:11245 length:1536 start_codon:yes stop_codon:yes gene_type:complete